MVDFKHMHRLWSFLNLYNIPGYKQCTNSLILTIQKNLLTFYTCTILVTRVWIIEIQTLRAGGLPSGNYKNRHKLKYTKVIRSLSFNLTSAFIKLLACLLICASSPYITAVSWLQLAIISECCAYFNLIAKRLWGCVPLPLTRNGSGQVKTLAGFFWWSARVHCWQTAALWHQWTRQAAASLLSLLWHQLQSAVCGKTLLTLASKRASVT